MPVMKEVYRSKISPQIIVPMAIIIAVVFIVMVVLDAWPGILIIALLGAFIVHLFATTYYIIDGNELRIRSGFLINTKIDINAITKIEPTNSILSAPALSTDRLEIFYNKYDSVMISPPDKTVFIERLKAINNGIDVVCSLTG